MSASEIIEQIKALPAEEQERVLIFAESLRNRAVQSGTDPAREPIEAIAERIFDRYDPLFRKLAE